MATKADPARLVVLGLALTGLALASAWFLRNFRPPDLAESSAIPISFFPTP